MNTEKSKTDKFHIFRLKNPHKNIALANVSICFIWKKTLNLNMTAINSKYLLQYGMVNLIYQMDQILFLTLKTILNTLLKRI